MKWPRLSEIGVAEAMTRGTRESFDIGERYTPKGPQEGDPKRKCSMVTNVGSILECTTSENVSTNLHYRFLRKQVV